MSHVKPDLFIVSSSHSDGELLSATHDISSRLNFPCRLFKRPRVAYEHLGETVAATLLITDGVMPHHEDSEYFAMLKQKSIELGIRAGVLVVEKLADPKGSRFLVDTGGIPRHVPAMPLTNWLQFNRDQNQAILAPESQPLRLIQGGQA